MILALQGAYVYRGVVNESNPTQTQLNDTIFIMGRSAIVGDVLVDYEKE